MDIAISHGFSPREIKFINYCRLYFQCLTVSDLSSACGTKLAPGIYSGEKSPAQSISTLSEPYQEHPGKCAWQAWRKFLRVIACRPGKLHQSLGKWLKPAHNLRRRWPFLFSSTRRELFKRSPSGYITLFPMRQNVYSFPSVAVAPELPIDCLPIDADLIADGYRIRVCGSLVDPPSLPYLSSLSFREYLGRQEDHERCALLRFDTLGRDIHDVVDDKIL